MSWIENLAMQDDLKYQICPKAALRQTGSLPCASWTRQNPFYSRQRLCRVLHTAKTTRRTCIGKSNLCRVHVWPTAKGSEGARRSTFVMCWHTTKLKSLPCATAKAHSKQKLCRVPQMKHMTNKNFAVCLNYAPSKQKHCRVSRFCRVSFGPAHGTELLLLCASYLPWVG